MTCVKRAGLQTRRLLRSWTYRVGRHEAGAANPMQRGRAMNSSIATADRITHLKIVVLGLAWAILAMGTAIALA